MITTAIATASVFGQDFAVVPLALAAAGLMLMGLARRRLSGTTLVAPWSWAMMAMAVQGAAHGFGAAPAADAVNSWIRLSQYAAATATVCPIIAVLGAKRPQDRSWQFVVVSLWAILLVPELLRHIYHQPVHAAWSWFLLGLIALGALNYLPTRNGISALLLAVGQLLLLRTWLPLSLPDIGPAAPLVAMASLVSAITLAMGINRRWRPAAESPTAAVDRMWRDFRDAFGALWALRVAGRMAAESRMYDWGVTIGWRGLVHSPTNGATDAPPPDEIPPEVLAAVERSLSSQLRRFVSPAWIDARRVQMSKT